MATRGTYLNRHININSVVYEMGGSGGHTATSLSKVINLSRQTILDILKQAKSWGYVTEVKTPYRYKKNSNEVLVYKSSWIATKYGRENANHYISAIQAVANGKLQLPLF